MWQADRCEPHQDNQVITELCYHASSEQNDECMKEGDRQNRVVSIIVYFISLSLHINEGLIKLDNDNHQYQPIPRYILTRLWKQFALIYPRKAQSILLLPLKRFGKRKGK